jgi:hypothetical protein
MKASLRGCSGNKLYVIPTPVIPRRAFLASGIAAGASVLLGRMAGAASLAGFDGPALKESDIDTNGITLHVTEQGNGPAVLFCHGFPDTSYTWRRQMKTVASSGYRAIAPDMRGYLKSSNQKTRPRWSAPASPHSMRSETPDVPAIPLLSRVLVG